MGDNYLVISQEFERRVDELYEAIPSDVVNYDSLPPWAKMLITAFKGICVEIKTLNSLSSKRLDYLEVRNCVNEQLLQKFAKLENENKILSDKVANLERIVDEHEQYSRRNCLLFHGIDETVGEDLDELVVDIIRDKLELRDKRKRYRKDS